MEYLYKTDGGTNITNPAYILTTDVLKTQYQADYPNNIVSTVLVTGEIMDKYGNYRYKVVSGDPVLKDDSDWIVNTRAKKLKELKGNAFVAIGEITQNEYKAKTLAIQALIDSVAIPIYWTDWKTARDTIITNYQTKKTYINDGVRTFTELDTYDTSL